MKHRIDLYVPTKKPDGSPVPESYLLGVREMMIRYFKGVSEYDVRGFWDTGEGTYVEDAIRIMYSLFDDAEDDMHTLPLAVAYVQDLAEDVRRQCEQECVLYVLDGVQSELVFAPGEDED